MDVELRCERQLIEHQKADFFFFFFISSQISAIYYTALTDLFRWKLYMYKNSDKNSHLPINLSKQPIMRSSKQLQTTSWMQEAMNFMKHPTEAKKAESKNEKIPSAKWSETPDILQCMVAPPKSSAETSSPVAAYQNCSSEITYI